MDTSMHKIPQEVVEILEKFNTKENRLIVYGFDSTGETKLKRAMTKALSVLPDKWSVCHYTVHAYPVDRRIVHDFDRFVIRRVLDDKKVKKSEGVYKNTVWDLLTGKQLFMVSTRTSHRWAWYTSSFVVAKSKKDYVPLGEPKYFLDKEDKSNWVKLEQNLLVCADVAEDIGENKVAELLRFLTDQKENIYRLKVPKT